MAEDTLDENMRGFSSLQESVIFLQSNVRALFFSLGAHTNTYYTDKLVCAILGLLSIISGDSNRKTSEKLLHA